MADDRQIHCLVSLVSTVRLATEAVREEGLIAEESLPTSSDLAKSLGFKLDYVKKQLKILKNYEIILAVGINPKRYRFDPFRFEALKRETEGDETLRAVFEQLVENAH